MIKTTITSISLPTELFKQLEETKERTKMTRSRIIIEALQKYMGTDIEQVIDSKIELALKNLKEN